MRRRPLALGLALALAAACGDATGPRMPEDVVFAAALGIDLARMTRLSSGVYIETLTPGTGTAQLNTASRFSATYKGYLPNGAVFDEGEINNFFVSGFIQGFQDGLVGMKVGEGRRIIIPSHLAYGESPPTPTIPKHSVLIFDVAVTSIN